MNDWYIIIEEKGKKHYISKNVGITYCPSDLARLKEILNQAIERVSLPQQTEEGGHP